MPLGLYISVPFCRTKCSYCNFASDVFSRAVFERYVDRVCSDIIRARETAEQMGGQFDRDVDTVYLGGGTPTVLDINQLQRLFVTISQNFNVLPDAEITIECAPGTLTPAMLHAFQSLGVNRVSLGVQSFVDAEAASVGRLHQRTTVLDDIARLRAAGIANLNIDLIAGLPHQTKESWEVSLAQTIASGVPHTSVYLLEVDEDSRLGRELIAGGTRYHAHFVPDEDQMADFYETACERLNAAGIRQYEISNFARAGCQSRHNLKYWTRQPYLGFGVDAHSMLSVINIDCEPGEGHDFSRGAKSSTFVIPRRLQPPGNMLPQAFQRPLSAPAASAYSVRFAMPDSLERYVSGCSPVRTLVSHHAALEEFFFLGLRLTRGVDLDKVIAEFGEKAVGNFSATITECVNAALMQQQGNTVCLTPRGRLLSNEVFERFIATAESTQ